MSDYVVYERDGEYELESPDGEVLATYDEKPEIPQDIAREVEEDFSNNPQDMFLFMMEQRWTFKRDTTQ